MDNEKFQELILQQLKQINQRLDEHAMLLKALEHASQVHKADMDNLNNTVARLEGKLTRVDNRLNGIEDKLASIESEIEEMKEINKSLLEMYGEHEAHIRAIKRKVRCE